MVGLVMLRAHICCVFPLVSFRRFDNPVAASVERRVLQVPRVAAVDSLDAVYFQPLVVVCLPVPVVSIVTPPTNFGAVVQEERASRRLDSRGVVRFETQSLMQSQKL